MPTRQALLDAMRERRITPDDLARLLGRDRTSVSKWIHGRVDPPTSVSLRLELILGVPARTLFADLLDTMPARRLRCRDLAPLSARRPRGRNPAPRAGDARRREVKAA